MINIKKFSLLVMGLGLSAAASAAMYEAPPAAAVTPEPAAKSGFYAGIGLGGMALEQQNSSATVVTPDGETDVINSSDDQGGIGFNTVLLAGYGWALPHQFHLGVEAFGNYTNTVASSSLGMEVSQFGGAAGNHDGQMTLNYVYGVRALPGYQATPEMLFYGIVGYARAHIDKSSSGDFSFGSTTEDLPSSTTSYDFNGLQLGLGSMFDITEHVAIRGDLIYTGYQSKSLDFTDEQGSVSSETQPYTLEADVALVYKFD